MRNFENTERGPTWLPFMCLKCGWLHFGMTPEQVENEVNRFNAYFDDLDPLLQEDYYGGQRSTIERYKHCFNCGSDHTKVVACTKKDTMTVPDGCTIQPIMISSP